MHFPDMNLLVALDALLDEGSVVGAARRMNLSPAAMSRTLTRIRHAVGDPILVRAGRGLVPTPKAMALRSQVRSVVEQANQVFSSSDEVDLQSLERLIYNMGDDILTGKQDHVGGHGTGKARQDWFGRGLRDAHLTTCNTFVAPANEVR